MRFAIASSVLAAVLPPGLSLKTQLGHALANINFDPDSKEKHIHQQRFTKDNGHRMEFGKRNRENVSPWRNSGLMKNGETKNSNVECILDTEADIGVLSCGTNEYCKEMSTSSLGGVCVPNYDKLNQRNLQFEGFAHYQCYVYPSPDCDCSAWDSITNTGIVECYYDSGCSKRCGYDYCVSFFSTYVNDGESFLYNHTVSVTGSIETTFSHITEKDISGEYMCEISLDGTACSSCTYLEYSCASYDCTNVGAGTYNCTDGTGDGIYIFPIVKYCNYTMECDLCSEGEFVGDENATVDFPFGTFSCGFIYGITESGAYNYPDLCEYIIHYGQDSCCDGPDSSDESSDSRSSDESSDSRSSDDK